MRRVFAVVLILLMMPQIPASASEDPFNMIVPDDVIIHPGETVPFRIVFHNHVGNVRHIQMILDDAHSNLTVENLPLNSTRVASGRISEHVVNLTMVSDSDYETTSFTFTATCDEVPDWNETFTIDVIVSRWSNLNFGANDGSAFYVQQNVNTTLAVNLSNDGMFDDVVKIQMDTSSNWDFGFVDDLNNDDEVLIDLDSEEFLFVNFWIITPPVLDGAPLAGTGPMFSLQAVSGLDRQVTNWTFTLEMQTYHNMTIDLVQENLSLSPDDVGLLNVTVRNNGNTDTLLDATLEFNGTTSDRFEEYGWTIALFNAFESLVLEPNESRTIQVGFDAPNQNLGSFEVGLKVMPQNFPQRTRSVSLSSAIDWQRGGSLSADTNTCDSVEWNQTCQKMIYIENTGNYFDEFRLELVDAEGMNFDIEQGPFGYSRGDTGEGIALNMTPIEGIEGLTPSSVTVRLLRIDGVILDEIQIESETAPYVNWVWESAESSRTDDRLFVVMTMRNDGNFKDGLIVRMSTSYYTDMSFIPPEGAIVEDGSTNIRSFEMIDIDRGSNFTFRAWADIPDDQISSDDFFINLTAHSRLASENPFIYSVNTTFEAMPENSDDGNAVVNFLSVALSTTWDYIWAWKWILIAMVVSGMMIKKSLRDRRDRLAEIARNTPPEKAVEEPEDWMAEFNNKRQEVPSPAASPEMPAEAFTGMFQAIGGERKPVSEPVNSQLVGAANTVLDHHDIASTKSKADNLVTDIAIGDVSTPHSANVALPDDIVPVTQRTVPIVKKEETNVPAMLDLDDLDL